MNHLVALATADAGRFNNDENVPSSGSTFSGRSTAGNR
jgi:hypothetical protein